MSGKHDESGSQQVNPKDTQAQTSAHAKQSPGRLSDDVRQAAASGEPSLTGRTHGHPINGQGSVSQSAQSQSEKQSAGSQKGKKHSHNDNTSGKSGKVSQATESGRQRAVE